MLCLAGRAEAQSNPAAARLAIVAEDPASRDASDVLTAELSKRADLQMLERAEIEKVYREQGLSAANTDCLKLGRIMGADGLLVLALAGEKGRQFLELRLVAVKPGVSLASERFAWPVENLVQWAAGTATHLGPLIPKLTVLVKDAVPLSIVNFRSSIQTSEERELEKQVTLLTIHRLSREKQLFILERRKMQLLTGENELNGLDSGFWNGSYLLDGTIDRDAYSPETMTISARLIPPNGGSIRQIELRGSRTNISGIVNQLAEDVLASLKLHPPAPWNLSDEAEQFASDARWAYRWGLFTQAQAASESAWALGQRTKELAALRIRAYVDSVWALHDESDDFQIPAAPDGTLLNPLARALELYCHDARVEFPNAAPLDEEWYMDGVLLVRISAEMLDGFYHAAEMREGYEEQIADVRALTRQTVSLLGSEPRPTPEGTPNNGRSKHSFSNTILQNLKRFDLAKWNEGGLMFEKPEDALPMFRGMLEQGYMPLELPRIIGWTWNDRKRTAGVTKQFIAELCASTNLALRLEGLSLALIKTPFYPEISFHERESELLSAIWENRGWVLSRPEHVAILLQAENILRQPDKYAISDLNSYFTQEPFASLRQRLRKEYLVNITNYDQKVFEALFSRNRFFLTQVEAQELAPLLEGYGPTNDWLISDTKRRLRNKAGLITAETPKKIAIAPMPPEELVHAVFVPWQLKNPDMEDGLHPKQQRLIVHNGRLWARICYLADNTLIPMSAPTAFVSIDPESGICREITFPEKTTFKDTGFDLTDDSLYVSTKSGLHRYRFRQETWEKIPVPLDEAAQVVAVKGRIYLTTATALLEVEPETRAIQLLASSRRLPAVNNADSLWNVQARTYSRSDRKLGVLVSNRFLSLDPATRAWTEGPEVPKSDPFNNQVFSFSGGGAHAVFPATRWDRFLLGYWHGMATLDSLLEDHKAALGESPNPALTKGLEPTRWDWPARFELESSRIIADDNALWVLAPRHISTIGFIPTEPVAFSDNRNATLFRFEPESRRPLSVGVAFESHESVVDPFEPKKGGFLMEWHMFLFGVRALDGTVSWLQTPAGLVYEIPALAGHWLIPASPLEKRLASLRANGRKEANVKEPESPAPNSDFGDGHSAARAANSPGGTRP